MLLFSSIGLSAQFCCPVLLDIANLETNGTVYPIGSNSAEQTIVTLNSYCDDGILRYSFQNLCEDGNTATVHYALTHLTNYIEITGSDFYTTVDLGASYQFYQFGSVFNNTSVDPSTNSTVHSGEFELTSDLGLGTWLVLEIRFKMLGTNSSNPSLFQSLTFDAESECETATRSRRVAIWRME